MARFGRASMLSVALLVLTVGAGFLGGVAWQGNRTATPEPDETPDQEPRDRDKRRLVIDEVGLEPAKQEEVEAIVQHFMARMRGLDEEFRQAYRPKHRALLHEARDSIKSVLQPEQRALYDSLLAVRYGNDRGEGDTSGSGKGKGHPDRRGER